MIQESVSSCVSIPIFRSGCIDPVKLRALLQGQLRLIEILGAAFGINRFSNHSRYTVTTHAILPDSSIFSSCYLSSLYVILIPRVFQKLADFEAGASKFDQAKPIVEEGPVLHRPDKARSNSGDASTESNQLLKHEGYTKHVN